MRKQAAKDNILSTIKLFCSFAADVIVVVVDVVVVVVVVVVRICILNFKHQLIHTDRDKKTRLFFYQEKTPVSIE